MKMSNAQHPIMIIAEIGVNHNGDIEIAKQLIDVAARAGADAVKFQTYISEEIVSPDAQKAAYQKQNEDRGDESQYEMLKRLELSFSDHFQLKEYAEQAGIAFLSTAFGVKELNFLTDELKLTAIKLGSGDLTNLPLLYAIARKGVRLIISTGMADDADIETALGILAKGYAAKAVESDWSADMLAQYGASAEAIEILRPYLSIMQCTSAYPCPPYEVNLKAIRTLEERYGLPTGFSDHSLSEISGAAAAALGVSVIEKHITLDHDMAGPDHKASLIPEAFARYVNHIREAESYLGNGEKNLSEQVRQVKDIAGKKLVAMCDIAEGQLLSQENLTTRRAEGGVPARLYYDYIGSTAERNYRAGEAITTLADRHPR